MKYTFYLVAFVLLDVLLPREDKGGCSCSHHEELDQAPTVIEEAGQQTDDMPDSQTDSQTLQL